MYSTVNSKLVMQLSRFGATVTVRNFPTSEGDTRSPRSANAPAMLAKFPDPAANTIGVRLTEAAEPGEVAFVQSVAGWRDRRGRAGLASLGILLDVAAGSGRLPASPRERMRRFVHISVSMVPWAVIGDGDRIIVAARGGRPPAPVWPPHAWSPAGHHRERTLPLGADGAPNLPRGHAHRFPDRPAAFVPGSRR